MMRKKKRRQRPISLQNQLDRGVVIKFALRFLAFTGVFFAFFDLCERGVGRFYVAPISNTASVLLNALNIVVVVIPYPATGSRLLVMKGVSYWVTQGCTGLFTSALYISGVLAFPTSIIKKLAGCALGFPAFFMFGVLRIVIMGAVAQIWPAQIEVFHLYIMAIANLGFAMFVWIYWHNKVVEGEKTRSVFG